MTRTKQDVFNEVWAKITAQGRASYEDGACQYRTRRGASCAIGCLIDDATAARLPNRTIDEIEPEFLPGWMRRMVGFLAKLQDAHDNAASAAIKRGAPFIPEFHKNMRDLTASENLTVPT